MDKNKGLFGQQNNLTFIYWCYIAEAGLCWGLCQILLCGFYIEKNISIFIGITIPKNKAVKGLWVMFLCRINIHHNSHILHKYPEAYLMILRVLKNIFVLKKNYSIFRKMKNRRNALK